MTKNKQRPNAFARFWQKLGPGLITGASDDDPSGIATYSQAGAMYGLSTLWTVLVGILGTTISPYLFFWQTSMEVEEVGKLHNTIVVDKKLITGSFVNGRWSNIFGAAALLLMSVAAGVLIYFWL